MSTQPLIIGITGHKGAGRTSVSRALAEIYQVEPLSVSSMLADLERSSGNPHPTFRDLQERGDSLRQKSSDAVAKLATEELATRNMSVWVVDGIMNPAEAHLLSQQGRFFMVAVQASTQTRWKRVEALPDFKANRTEFDEVDRRDNREVDGWGVVVHHGQRVADCIPVADAMIWNDEPYLTSEPIQNQGTQR